MPVADLSSSAAKARNAEPAAPDVIEATTAYLVYTKKDTGQVVLTTDINAPVHAERQPSHDEIYMLSHVIIKDILGQQYGSMAAQATLQLNSYVAQQAQMQSQLDLKNLGRV